MRLNSITILGLEYSITYVNSPSEVDIYKRDAMWGQIDYWTRTIRVFERDRSDRDIFETLMHEVLHGIAERLKLKTLTKAENHDDLDLLALALAEVLCNNGLINIDNR